MTTWTYEVDPGATWLAGQEGINAGSETSEIDQLTVYAGVLGTATAWTYTSRN